MGKGQTPRPFSVPINAYHDNFEETFGVLAVIACPKCDEKQTARANKTGKVHVCPTCGTKMSVWLIGEDHTGVEAIDAD